MYLQGKVLKAKKEEKESGDAIAVILVLGPKRYLYLPDPSIPPSGDNYNKPIVITCPQRLMSEFLRVRSVIPFKQMYSHFYHTRGFMNGETRDDCTSNGADTGDVGKLFDIGVRLSASSCNVQYPPNPPTTSELAANAAELRHLSLKSFVSLRAQSPPSGVIADGIPPADPVSISGESPIESSSRRSVGPDSPTAAPVRTPEFVDLTSSPLTGGCAKVSPSSMQAKGGDSSNRPGQLKDDRAHDSDCVPVDPPMDPRGLEAVPKDFKHANRPGQPKDDRAYDSDCVPVDPPMDPRGPEAVAKDFEYAKMLSEEGKVDPRGSEAVENDFRIARELSEANANDFKYAKMLSEEEGKRNPRPWKPRNKKRPTKSRHKKAVHAKFAKHLRPSPINKYLDRLGAYVAEAKKINVKSTNVPANQVIAANFRTGLLLAESGITKMIFRIKNEDSLSSYCCFVFDKFRKYTHALQDIVDCDEKITIESMSQITRDEHIAYLIEGSIRGAHSTTYDNVCFFMGNGQIAPTPKVKAKALMKR